MNETFNRKYSELILPLYGKRRNIDLESRLLQDNILPHTYAVNDRVDMTSSVTYSIDPSGCEDADDAFSIYREEDKLFLAIHIADPTEYTVSYTHLTLPTNREV